MWPLKTRMEKCIAMYNIYTLQTCISQHYLPHWSLGSFAAHTNILPIYLISSLREQFQHCVGLHEWFPGIHQNLL